jgi:beta-glucanase (GH16 family)
VWATAEVLGEGGWSGTAPGQFNSANVVAIGGSSAEFTTRHEEGYNPMGGGAAACNSTCGLRFGEHSSGILVSKDTFTYGYFEAVVAGAASANGLRTSFWLQGAGGEINIADVFNNGVSTTVSNNFHCWADANDAMSTISTANSDDTKVEASMGIGDSLDGANKYGVLWTSEVIIFYVNERVHRTITNAAMPCINAPMHLILSTETALSSQATLISWLP